MVLDLKLLDLKLLDLKLKSSLCDYSDVYILGKRRITITGAGDDVAASRLDERNKTVVFKNCAPFTNCKSEINIDKVMPMYNRI